MESGVQSGRLAGARLEGDDPDARLPAGDRAGDVRSPIRAPVVDQDDLELLLGSSL
jgi:hypothetical protein